MARRLTITMVMFLVVAGLAQDGQQAVDPSYRQAIEKWKSGLIERRKQNWLSLAGLLWLKPGANSFGTDPKNKLVLPEHSAPPMAGEFDLHGTDVTVKIAPGVKATIEGKPLTTAKMQPDTAEETTVIELGQLRMHVIVRGERIGVRVKDFNSPAIRSYPGADFYPINTAYKITAAWEPSDGKKTVEVPDVLGDVTPTPVAGEAVFKIGGQQVRLSALVGDSKDELFFIFKDLTSKTETYPAGRFLYTPAAATDNTVVLDFNQAYNPPCSLTPYATCPLPPRQNQLAVAVPAGEKYDHKAGHH